MRKKSHISLAGYLVRELRLGELSMHRKAFYLGSILPDLTPKMFAEPHQFDTSYEGLQENIGRIAKSTENGGYNERVLWRRIGLVMHYLADYFTYPHNTSYDGNLKDHCLYERDMKYWLRRYVRTPEAMMIFREQRIVAKRIGSIEELFEHIEQVHSAYMEVWSHSVEDDCRWIVSVCSLVLLYFAAILEISQDGRMTALFCAA